MMVGFLLVLALTHMRSLASVEVAKDKCLLQKSKAVKQPLQHNRPKNCNLRSLPGVKPRSFEDFDHGSYNGLYVNKSANFAFCIVTKNACGAWTKIFQKLTSGNPNNTGPVFGIGRATWPGAKDATEVFQSKDSVRAVFVRDPLERFLSGFLDKCRDTCESQFCLMRSEEQKGVALTFNQAIAWVKNPELDLSVADDHFKTQSRHCELDWRINEYTHLAVMESDTLADNAACLLDLAGLSHLDATSSAADAPPFWRPPSDAAHQSAKKIEMMKAFYTKESADIVYNKYLNDYKVFGLPRPSWIDSAHGSFAHKIVPCGNITALGGFVNSLYAAVPSESDDVDSEGSQRFTQVDDIVALANSAGFSLESPMAK